MAAAATRRRLACRARRVPRERGRRARGAWVRRTRGGDDRALEIADLGMAGFRRRWSGADDARRDRASGRRAAELAYAVWTLSGRSDRCPGSDGHGARL